MRRVKLIEIVLIVGVYGSSFALPVLSDPQHPQATTYGASVFVGSFGLLFRLQPGWLANPCLWVGVYHLHREYWLWAAVLGVLALVLGAHIGIWADGRGDGGTVYRLGVGHYVWLTSFGLLTLVGLLGSARRWKGNRII
jgi:hypothetical protein